MMVPQAAKTLGLFLSVCAVSTLAIANFSTAEAHPHNVLQTCKLADGTEVMCSETIHDVLTNEHVAKGAVSVPGNMKNRTTKPRRRRKLQVRN